MPAPRQIEGAPPTGGPPRANPDSATNGGVDANGRRRGSIKRLATASYLGLALGLVTSPIIARVLGPEARGQYAAVYVFENAMMIVIALGIPAAITYRLVNRLDSPEALMGSALRFCAALILPAAALAVGLTLGVLTIPEGTTTFLAIVALGLAPTSVLSLCLQGFLTSAGALGPLAYLRVAPLAANFVSVIALAATHTLTLGSYLAATVAISILSTVLAWYFVGVRPRGHVRFKALLDYGMRSYGGSFARLINVKVDQVILVPLVSPDQLAFYAIAVTITGLPQGVAGAIGTRTLGSIIGPERLFLAHRAERYLRLNLIVSVVASIAIAGTAPFLVPLLYGHAFAGIVAPLLLLLPGAIANAGTQVATPCLLALNRPGITSIAEASALAITGLGLWYALPRYGISGAAAISSAAYIYRYVFQLAALRRYEVKHLRPGRQDFGDLIRAIPRPRRLGLRSP